MAFVNPNSCECTNSELDLFAVQPTQTSIEEASVVEYHPINSLANRAPTLTYPAAASSTSTRTIFNCTCVRKLYDRAWAIISSKIALSNRSTSYFTACFRNSLFSQVNVSLSSTLISNSTNTYPYRAMLETLLSYGSDAKASQLTSEMYYKDDAGRMDAFRAVSYTHLTLPTIYSV